VKFFSRNLTDLAKNGTLPSLHSREKVIQQAITVLNQEGKASLVFTGEPGVGKTSLVEGLAQRIASKNVPEHLHNMTIHELDINALAAGTIYHGQFEENMKELIDWLLSHPSAIIFVDEFHSILSIGSDQQRVSPFANLLKPYLARGQVKMIGATTNREYEEMNAKDSALTRRFVRIDVPEPTRDEAVKILLHVGNEEARRGGILLGDGVIDAAVNLSIKYVHDRRLPDKAIDLLRGCIGKVSTERIRKATTGASSIPALLSLIDRELKALEAEEWSGAGDLASEWFRTKADSDPSLTVADLQKFAIERYGGMDSGDTNTVTKVLGLEAELRNSLIGQERAISAVSSALRRMTALGQSTRPIGSFLFLGPTGVGKTELCRAVSKQLWSGGALLQYNMSEYMTREDATKLIGSSPGYIGYGEGGRLVRDVAQKPSGVVLFDEIEKAHPDVHNLLLQILEEGKLQDSTGKVCSFAQSLVMLTSNVAAEWIATLSKEDLEQRYDEIQRVLLERLKRDFRPEIINRIDEIVIFTPLGEDDLEKILGLLIADENRMLTDNHRPSIELTAAARSAVLKRGYDPSFGARPLRRALQQMVMTRVADYLLERTMRGKATGSAGLVVDNLNGEVVIMEKGEVLA
jgi:ATP-dependent Clp protease ATP-binding subunit ClpC